MKHAKTKIGFGVSLALALMSGSASALSLYEYSYMEDDNIDTMSFDANGNGKLDAGDRLTALLDFGKIIEQTSTGAPTGNSYVLDPSKELTGISEVEVASVTALGFGSFYIAFKPYAAFEAMYGAGAMVALFEDAPGSDLNVATDCLSVAACSADATDGALWAVLGLGDADDQWSSIGSDNFAAAAAGPSATKYSTVNFGLSVLTNSTGYLIHGDNKLDCVSGLFACAGDGMTQIVGSADILGGAGLDPNHVRSDTDFTMHVPEPTSVALMGLGLLGLGVASRRRKA